MTLPNLVVAGAPKCGTSSLYRWLADHPQACGSAPKETFYLMDEGHPLARRGSDFRARGLEGYAEFFADCEADARVRFEATTHYIYQRTALEVLSRLPTRPRIVFLLRKPSERVYSSFRYSQNNLANVSRALTFARFVELSARSGGGTEAEWDALAGASAYVLRNDIRYSRYVEYVSAWVERFGRERVDVLLFEEMRSNPRAFMKRFAARVGLDASFYDSYDFPVKNETFGVRYPSLHRGVRRLNELVPAAGLKDALKRVYVRAQSGGASARKATGKTPEDARALEELEREFLPFNRRLADELGLNLSAWE
ncbi:MAG TPA: sulfotransferase domain-containing protein [Pyrinomonadaceae bacterium]|nr:sulfotransferase domain-containing protein [Pyrinomonadaceae bacterium]